MDIKQRIKQLVTDPANKDKDTVRMACRMTILAEMKAEFETAMQLHGISYEHPGYADFARQFCDNQIRGMNLEA